MEHGLLILEVKPAICTQLKDVVAKRARGRITTVLFRVTFVHTVGQLEINVPVQKLIERRENLEVVNVHHVRGQKKEHQPYVNL